MKIVKNFNIEIVRNSNVSLDEAKKIFVNSTQKILYVTDNKGIYLGCITLGNIINASYPLNPKNLINFSSKRIYSGKNEEAEASEIFSSNNNIKNIPVIDKDGKLIYEYQIAIDISHILKAIDHIKKQGATVFPAYSNGLQLLKTYMTFRGEEYKISNILENIDKFEPFLKSIYGERYQKGYFEKVANIPPVIKKPSGELVHQDIAGEYLNVINGNRLTIGNTGNYKIKVSFISACRFFGYAVEDKDTIPSYVQKLFNEIFGKNKIEIQNRGIWGIPEEYLYNNVLKLHFDENEIVIMILRRPIKLNNIIELTDAFYNLNLKNEFYFDRVGHCNHQLNKRQAEIIVNALKPEIQKRLEKKQYTLKNKINIKTDYICEYEKDIKNYIKNIYEKYGLKKSSLFKQTVGSVIVNCNPFTNGHHYLISQASKLVDSLIVFVVEEDKSFFSFNDRYKLVKQGLNDIKNVFVLPSGKFMISTLTFPGYFIKDMPEAVGFDMSKDIMIFGKYIAPEFNITKRFLGEEPYDIVTKKYNENLKETLSEYNIEVVIFPRKKEGNEIISASRVRNYIKNKEFEKLKNFVPDTTLQYIKSNF